jgi:hypothetical protein
VGAADDSGLRRLRASLALEAIVGAGLLAVVALMKLLPG